MAIIKKTRYSKKITPRKKQSLDLDEWQIEQLARLWNEYSGGIDEFAKEVAKREAGTATPTPAFVASAMRQLQRNESGQRPVSKKKFRVYADVLKMTTDVLRERLSNPAGAGSIPKELIPWVTDEEVLKKYRTLLHHYHQTKQGDDIFWIYTPIDFTEPHPGCLHASVRMGLHGELKYKAYGYLFRHMLVIILKSNDEGDYGESVHLYYDFRKKVRDTLGLLGVLFLKKLNGTDGFGGSLLFKTPFPGTEAPGHQSSALSTTLSEYWQVLDGSRFDRILNLFDYPPYSRPEGAWDRLKAVVNASEKIEKNARG
jgi:hypothetical protein